MIGDHYPEYDVACRKCNQLWKFYSVSAEDTDPKYIGPKGKRAKAYKLNNYGLYRNGNYLTPEGTAYTNTMWFCTCGEPVASEIVRESEEANDWFHN